MLKDSGEIENSASKIILLSQIKEKQEDEKKEKNNLVVGMEVEVAKNRDGKLGIIKMAYDKTTQVFIEAERK